MNKLTALSKLANAYYHLYVTDTTSHDVNLEALHILSDRFHYIRRSLTLLDLAPQPKCTEGFNPAGPKYL